MISYEYLLSLKVITTLPSHKLKCLLAIVKEMLLHAQLTLGQEQIRSV